MKCPNCGNENPTQFMPTKMAYMSAFSVDNDAYKCKSCGKDFYPQPILEPMDITVNPNVTHSSRRVKQSGLFVPSFPSYPLPPLDPTKAVAPTLTEKEMKMAETQRESQLEKKQEAKLMEAMDWAKNQEFKSMKKSNELSEYNPYKKKKVIDEI